MKVRKMSDPVVRNWRLRMMHVSDTHGGFPRLLGRFDCVLHTGDFFPNSQHCLLADKSKEMKFQLQWLRDNINDIRLWLGGRPLLYVPGNHDFLHQNAMEFELQSAGIEAYGIADRLFKFGDVNFYGFPYVPTINGNWNYEREIPEMQKEADQMLAILNAVKVDVLACHCPPYKCLDLSYGNEILGSSVLSNMLDYGLAADKIPSIYCCGHIHEAHGLKVRNGVLVSNAATTYQIVEV